MSLPDPDPPDAVVAAVLAAASWFCLVEREDVIAWADRCIERTEHPPGWMIELSLSHDLHVVDVLRLLNEVGRGVDSADICRGLYAFLPDPTGYSLDDAEGLARQIYRIAQHCFNYDWTNNLLCEADSLEDTFVLVRDGTIAMATTALVEKVREFLGANRDPRVRDWLRSLKRYVPPKTEVP